MSKKNLSKARESFSKNFYNTFNRQLIYDFVFGNLIAEAAIKYALASIPPNVKSILDIGCGIGWSTSEIKRAFPKASVVGVDLSEPLVDIGRALFGDLDIQFKQWDAVNDRPFAVMFDAIIMLDVYEHIGVEDRANFHNKLDSMLSERGVIILSCPTITHQNHLRKHNPSGLQPINEDVTRETLENLGRDTNAVLAEFCPVSIWRREDYFHAFLNRNPTYPHRKSSIGPIKLEKLEMRSRKVVEKLGLRVTPDKVLLSERGKLNVCVVTPYPPGKSYSETFILNHIENLPANVRYLTGDSFPTHVDDGSTVVSFWMRFALKLLKKVNISYAQALSNSILARRFRRMRSNVVLAEYGVTGASVLEACKIARIPLVVHFHGYDAYETEVLERNAVGYRNLFKDVSAIIAVSKDMVDQLKLLGAPPQKIVHIAYGVEIQDFSGSEPQSSPEVFVSVGRFVDKKAPHLTILSFLRVLEKVPNAKLQMYGDGPLWDACQQMIRALEIDHAVELKGGQPHHIIANAMKGARAFVQHSLRPYSGDSEGTPVAIIEAGVTGIPVVATKHAGIMDVVIDGETGILVEERDIKGMAEAMIKLALNPKLAGEMGFRAKSRLQKSSSNEASLSKLMAVLEKVVQKQETVGCPYLRRDIGL